MTDNATAEPAEKASPTYASIDDLFGHDVAGVDTEDVVLPGGLVVRVRGLTRFELLNNGKGADSTQLIEARNVATCMVEPRLTVEQVERWQRSSAPPVLGKLSEAIRRLSGMGEGAEKSGVPADGDNGA